MLRLSLRQRMILPSLWNGILISQALTVWAEPLRPESWGSGRMRSSAIGLMLSNISTRSGAPEGWRLRLARLFGSSDSCLYHNRSF